MGTLIQNGTVVSSDRSQLLDVLMEGEKIAKVGRDWILRAILLSMRRACW